MCSFIWCYKSTNKRRVNILFNYYLIIYKSRSLNWKKAIEESETFIDGGKIPCILVENKIDLLEDQKEGEENLLEFAKNSDYCGCFRTSAKTGKNVSESMNFLIKLILKRIKDIGEKDISEEHKRETIKLESERSSKKDTKSNKCC